MIQLILAISLLFCYSYTWSYSSVYLKGVLPFAWDVSLESPEDSCFQLPLLRSVTYLFFLCRSPSLSLCTIFDAISSNVDEVSLDQPIC